VKHMIRTDRMKREMLSVGPVLSELAEVFANRFEHQNRY
jgi:hypothetical protein